MTIDPAFLLHSVCCPAFLVSEYLCLFQKVSHLFYSVILCFDYCLWFVFRVFFFSKCFDFNLLFSVLFCFMLHPCQLLFLVVNLRCQILLWLSLFVSKDRMMVTKFIVLNSFWQIAGINRSIFGLFFSSRKFWLFLGFFSLPLLLLLILSFEAPLASSFHVFSFVIRFVFSGLIGSLIVKCVFKFPFSLLPRTEKHYYEYSTELNLMVYSMLCIDDRCAVQFWSLLLSFFALKMFRCTITTTSTAAEFLSIGFCLLTAWEMRSVLLTTSASSCWFRFCHFIECFLFVCRCFSFFHSPRVIRLQSIHAFLSMLFVI